MPYATKNSEFSFERFLQEYPFATLVTHSSKGAIVSHLPLIYKKEESTYYLYGHMAVRSNEHWKYLKEGDDILVIFMGPNGYISPNWYCSDALAIPSWYHAMVHAHGKVKQCSNNYDQIVDHVKDMLVTFEAEEIDGIDRALQSEMMKFLGTFCIEIKRIEASLRLGQDRCKADRESVVKGLNRKGTFRCRELEMFLRYWKDLEHWKQ